MRVFRLILAGTLLAVLASVAVPLRYWMNVPDWELEGFSMTFCPCGTPCPCRSGRPPDQHTCEAATFVHVVRGRFGSVGIDDARFVTVANMEAGRDRWMILYTESAAPAAVRDALLRLGENMAMPRTFFAPLLAPFFRPRLTVRLVERIEYAASEGGLRRRVTIPGVLELDGRLRADADGYPRQQVPALDVLTNRIAYADNLVYRWTDAVAGRTLDYSGRQANMKSFRVTKEDYDANRLLAQDARAMRGRWTPHQRELIAAMEARGELRPERIEH